MEMWREEWEMKGLGLGSGSSSALFRLLLKEATGDAHQSMVINEKDSSMILSLLFN